MTGIKQNPAPRPLWRSTYSLGALAALGIIIFFLWTEHRAHLLGALPFLLLLLCPLLHFFMHSGHHHGHQGGSEKIDGNSKQGGQP